MCSVRSVLLILCLLWTKNVLNSQNKPIAYYSKSLVFARNAPLGIIIKLEGVPKRLSRTVWNTKKDSMSLNRLVKSAIKKCIGINRPKSALRDWWLIVSKWAVTKRLV